MLKPTVRAPKSFIDSCPPKNSCFLPKIAMKVVNNSAGNTHLIYGQVGRPPTYPLPASSIEHEKFKYCYKIVHLLKSFIEINTFCPIQLTLKVLSRCKLHSFSMKLTDFIMTPKYMYSSQDKAIYKSCINIYPTFILTCIIYRRLPLLYKVSLSNWYFQQFFRNNRMLLMLP